LLVVPTGCRSSQTSISSSTTSSEKTPSELETIKLNFGSVSYSPGSTREAMTNMLEKKIEAAFPDRIDFNLLTPGSIGADKALFEATQMNSVDMCVLADMSIDMALNTLGWAWLPYLYSTYEEVDEYYYNGWVAEEITKRIEASGVIKVGNYESGFRNFANNVRPINKFEDFKGLKVRVPELSYLMSFYKKLGTLPAVINSAEVVTALEQGTVDGQDNNIVSWRNTGTIDLCKYVFKMNYDFSGGSMIVSHDFWNKLTTEEQAKFKSVCYEVGEEAIELLRKEESDLIEKCLAGDTFTITEPDEAMKTKLKEAAMLVWEEEAAKYDKEVMTKVFETFGK